MISRTAISAKLALMNAIVSSVALFILAGVAEIGGGYLMWLWWRDGRSWPVGLFGALALVLYGIIPTYQPAHFGRVYAAYGGVFVILSVLWGWAIDGVAPDRYDWLGALMCVGGVAVIMYAPRAS
jgi:small multidrug resistance family-3 protein